MKDSKSDPTADIAREYQERETKDKQVLALLLEKFLEKKDRILVQKTEMGGTEAYVGSVTLEWFAGRVHFASGLPLFQNKYNSDTDNIEIDADSIDEIQQRPLDWSRQAPLVQYLSARKNHKFPPVLVVINQSWVDDPKASEWNNEGIATKSTTDFTPLDKDGKVGLLNISEDNVTIYALDGQHRLMGVQGLMELIKTGKLQRYKKDKTADDSFIKIDDLIEQYQVDSAYLQSLPKEKIGIEFICAVASGETRTQARRRVRSIFVHVNLMAAPLTKGQLVQLNEDDGFAIVARKIATNHPLLAQQPERKPRVNWNSATVAANSTVLTTLQAIQDMSERYLGQKFPHWKPLEKGLIPMRPEDNEIEEGIDEFRKLFDSLASLPSYKILEHEDTPQLRRFSFEKDGGEGNMLFRPIAQVALAQALGILVFKKGFSLTDIFKKLRKFDQQGGFSGMEYPQSLWYGVLYDPNKKRVQVAGRDLAAKLLIYILGGIKDRMESAELRKALADARTIENQTISFDGKFVEPQAVGLPNIL
ncbi:DGQHR domain-containing protein [Calothrix sp. FACHB-1219]|uniref:DGQHR domain-containing protein n=1 Tax=unclassified Calothrix TaxID=2619626 RepID=UPI0016858E7F|nr:MULTISPECIES: DGQHR domain-containing protein [unclassified Calothrix]MBD2205295.1 DGQHR domain-containing protein [Calothrix sp. FACHB-168]MBD2220068.1 DGQHR domain-containing protein [Calothrix sp. FACHB-1219]